MAAIEARMPRWISAMGRRTVRAVRSQIERPGFGDLLARREIKEVSHDDIRRIDVEN
jgi:hypothetical protein